MKQKDFSQKLVVFDVDGVLIDTEIGSFKDLGIILGKEAEIRAHHEEYERRAYFGPWGLEELAEIFRGFPIAKLEELAAKLVNEKLMKGARETIEELKKRGYIIVSYSSSPIFVMDKLKEIFRFKDICGNVLEVREGIVTGRLLEKADMYTKAERLRRFMEENKISRDDTYVIGDSGSDLPMAKYGHFIAFNCKEKEVEEEAENVVKKKDLRGILKYLN